MTRVSFIELGEFSRQFLGMRKEQEGYVKKLGFSFNKHLYGS